MNINVEDFKVWILDQPIDYKDKCCFAFLTDTYARNYSVETQTEDKKYEEWENWLDEEIAYHKNDISLGLPAMTYNALRRGMRYVNGEWKHTGIYTNRELYEASDRQLENIRNISKRKVENVRAYIEANRKRIFGEKT